MAKSYVLLSGGVDSSTCLAIAKKRHGSAKGISIKYGQRHEKETLHASQIAGIMGCEYECRDIRGVISRGGLTDKSLQIPSASYADLPHGVSPTYVPFRNGILLSIVAGMAVIDPEAEALYYGAHAEDAENDAYPDCSPPFINAMEHAIKIGTYERIKLEAPLAHMKKWEVVQEGQRLGVPWEHTWSCYEGGAFHCGVCPTCRARREAFTLAEVKDPTHYLQTPDDVVGGAI